MTSERWISLLVVACGLACASPPAPAPAEGRAGIVGRLAIVQREGVPDPRSDGAAYADRRLRDVALVDYSKPGFSVVHLDTGGSPGGRTLLRILEDRSGRDRLDPDHAVVGVGGTVELANEGDRSQVVSVPSAGVVRKLSPGESLEVLAEDPGELDVFLLDTRRKATVLVVAGPWAVVDPGGHFVLDDLEPGRFTLRAWHPRLPPWAHPIELSPDRNEYVEIQLGVGRGREESRALH